MTHTAILPSVYWCLCHSTLSFNFVIQLCHLTSIWLSILRLTAILETLCLLWSFVAFCGLLRSLAAFCGILYRSFYLSGISPDPRLSIGVQDHRSGSQKVYSSDSVTFHYLHRSSGSRIYHHSAGGLLYVIIQNNEYI